MFPENREDGLKIDPKSKHRPQKRKPQNKRKNRANITVEKAATPALKLISPSSMPFQPGQAPSVESNITAPVASSTRCSSYLMQIIPQANYQNTTTRVSNAPAL